MLGLGRCSPHYYDTYDPYGLPPWTSMFPPGPPPVHPGMMAASQFEQFVREEAGVDAEIEELQKQRDELDKKIESLKNKKTQLQQGLSWVKSNFGIFG